MQDREAREQDQGRGKRGRRKNRSEGKGGGGEGEGKREGMVSKYNIPKWKVEGAMGMEIGRG
jgi:hypothetical protein